MTEARTDPPVAVPAKEPAEALALRVRPRPVVRMSRRMIGLLIGVAAAGLAGAALWSLSKRVGGPGGSAELYNVDRVQTADGLAKLPSDYRRGVPQLGPPMPGDLGRPILRAQQEGRMEPVPAATAADPARQAALARAEQLRREREAVRRADVFFEGADQGSASAGGGGPAPVAAGPTGGTAAEPPAPAPGSQAAKRGFLAEAPDTRIYASGQMHDPASPYQLMAGTVIPAALVTAINSDLPGTIVATVTANVHDSVTGRHLLIPQGARLIGRYDSAVGYAQNRLLLRWERLIYPDGRSILLDNLPGTDAIGRAGLKDRTDNHFDRLIGGAVLATVLGVGSELGGNSVDADRSIVIATGDSARNVVGQIGQDITRRNLDVQPTLTIRPGFPLRVMVEKDLVLPPVSGR